MERRIYALMRIMLVLSILMYTSCKDNSSKINGNTKTNDEIVQVVDTTQITRPKMQVVFLLDATGSMSGLIGTAKEKIWSIAGSLAQTNPEPELEIGMIFYRDRGDEFVTKHIPLGNDLDNMYEQLMAMQAFGGGDAPESVNQAIHEGISQIQWDTDPKTYRAIFLVGDYPPHMDYKDDVKYSESCVEANKKNIIINTILMGNNSETLRIWKEIAKKTNGEFIQTDMNVNNISINTPYDDKINDLQYQLDQTRIYYGESSGKMVTKQVQSEKLSKYASSSVNARRSDYNMSKAGKKVYYGSFELINDVMNGKKLSDIKTSDLPDNMQTMSTSERQKYVDDLIEKRKKLEKEIISFNKQRQEYIDKEIEKIDKSKVKESFDDAIYKSVKDQAASKNIILEEKVKR